MLLWFSVIKKSLFLLGHCLVDRGLIRLPCDIKKESRPDQIKKYKQFVKTQTLVRNKPNPYRSQIVISFSNLRLQTNWWQLERSNSSAWIVDNCCTMYSNYHSPVPWFANLRLFQIVKWKYNLISNEWYVLLLSHNMPLEIPLLTPSDHISIFWS